MADQLAEAQEERLKMSKREKELANEIDQTSKLLGEVSFKQKEIEEKDQLIIYERQQKEQLEKQLQEKNDELQEKINEIYKFQI